LCQWFWEAKRNTIVGTLEIKVVGYSVYVIIPCVIYGVYLTNNPTSPHHTYCVDTKVGVFA